MPSSRIHILPEELVNKIAAGEVVERPASVVKELVENSIDAGADRISVEVQEAGRKLIRVSDNGHGMSREETEIAVQRHSTSKLRSFDDLFNIQRLGFRGEALPSIAGVSRFRLASRSRSEGTAGTQLKIEGGKAFEILEVGLPEGTTITIKDLFFNTPARKKFLKAPATELGHIGDIISKYALAFPNVSFQFISDGKPLLSTSGSGRLEDAVASVYGVELLKQLVSGERSFKHGKLYGLVGLPTLTRVDKSYETFFVNKRYVKNFLLNRALEDAYRTLIPGNRYPVAVIFIDIDPKLIDVNVHPAKREIKFADNNEVMQAIRDFVYGVLANIIGAEGQDKGTEAGMVAGNMSWKADLGDQIPISNFGEINIGPSASQPLIPLYQLKNTYLIATDGESLALIDQHAAHERVIYDQLCRQSSACSERSRGVVSRQSLLTPERIDINIKDTSMLSYLKELGFDIEEFGNNSYLVRSVPAISIKTPAKQLLIDIISELQSLGSSAQLEVKKELIRKTIACHSAVKAGDRLSPQEMSQLIKDLFSTDNPLTCPHGRPTMVRISEEELKKRFAR